LSIAIGTPEVHTDLVWSAFVLNEDTLRANMPNLFNLVLPMFASKFSRFDLPAANANKSS
jgi:hypothetical protein